MDAAELRAEVDRALVRDRWRVVLQIAVCAGTMLWAATLVRPLYALVVTMPPAAFGVAVTLGREQYVRGQARVAGRSEETLMAFFRDHLDQLLRRRRRLRFAGPLWTVAIWAAVHFGQLDLVPAMRAGVILICGMVLGVSANAVASVPHLVALRARLAVDPATAASTRTDRE